MEAKICTEMRAFLSRHHMLVSKLADLAGVPLPILTRVLSGDRQDMMSRNADAIREAMVRYEVSQQSCRQSGGEV